MVKTEFPFPDILGDEFRKVLERPFFAIVLSSLFYRSFRKHDYRFIFKVFIF